MPTAWIGLRDAQTYRRTCFEEGLSKVGYSISRGYPRQPKDGDLLLGWNRYGGTHMAAQAFERRGCPVLIAENCYIRPHGEKWYALALNHHNGAGKWYVGGPERFDAMGVELMPWRPRGETVILAQRGIGERGVAQPSGWVHTVRKLGRIRSHPGARDDRMPLEQDLARAGQVVTWGSGAAIKALAMGIPVFHGLKRWIGAQASRHLDDIALGPKKDDADRLECFRRLAWAQVSIDEIRSGEAFARLLEVHRAVA